jgi:uncharacterized protein (DUF488 family)
MTIDGFGSKLMQVADSLSVLTVGHSTHAWKHFASLLRGAGVTAVADVRTSPYSRRCPHFNRDELREKLRHDGVLYVFLGHELGGRPKEPQLYSNGVADYEKMAKTKEFSNGLSRVVEGAKNDRIALLCSERDPLNCHRCLLVGRALAENGVRVSHILDRGEVTTQAEIEDKLLELYDHDAHDLFLPRADRLAEAYRARARKVAFAQRPVPTAI